MARLAFHSLDVANMWEEGEDDGFVTNAVACKSSTRRPGRRQQMFHLRTYRLYPHEFTELATLVGVSHRHVVGCRALFPYRNAVLFDRCESTLHAYYVRRTTPLPEVQVLRLLVQMVDGLAALHTEGIVHGNLSLHNVLVEHQGDPDPHIKLSNAGYLQFNKRSDKSQKEVVGNGEADSPVVDTRSHHQTSAKKKPVKVRDNFCHVFESMLPPEAFVNNSSRSKHNVLYVPSVESDVWTLGVLCYRLMTRAFDEDDQGRRFREKTAHSGAVTAMRLELFGYSRDFQNLVVGMMAQSPSDRPSITSVARISRSLMYRSMSIGKWTLPVHLIQRQRQWQMKHKRHQQRQDDHHLEQQQDLRTSEDANADAEAPDGCVHNIQLNNSETQRDDNLEEICYRLRELSTDASDSPTAPESEQDEAVTSDTPTRSISMSIAPVDEGPLNSVLIIPGTRGNGNRSLVRTYASRCVESQIYGTVWWWALSDSLSSSQKSSGSSVRETLTHDLPFLQCAYQLLSSIVRCSEDRWSGRDDVDDGVDEEALCRGLCGDEVVDVLSKKIDDIVAGRRSVGRRVLFVVEMGSNRQIGMLRGLAKLFKNIEVIALWDDMSIPFNLEESETLFRPVKPPDASEVEKSMFLAYLFQTTNFESRLTSPKAEMEAALNMLLDVLSPPSDASSSPSRGVLRFTLKYAAVLVRSMMDDPCSLPEVLQKAKDLIGRELYSSFPPPSPRAGLQGRQKESQMDGLAWLQSHQMFSGVDSHSVRLAIVIMKLCWRKLIDSKGSHQRKLAIEDAIQIIGTFVSTHEVHTVTPVGLVMDERRVHSSRGLPLLRSFNIVSLFERHPHTSSRRKQPSSGTAANTSIDTFQLSELCDDAVSVTQVDLPSATTTDDEDDSGDKPPRQYSLACHPFWREFLHILTKKSALRLRYQNETGAHQVSGNGEKESDWGRGIYRLMATVFLRLSSLDVDVGLWGIPEEILDLASCLSEAATCLSLDSNSETEMAKCPLDVSIVLKVEAFLSMAVNDVITSATIVKCASQLCQVTLGPNHPSSQHLKALAMRYSVEISALGTYRLSESRIGLVQRPFMEMEERRSSQSTQRTQSRSTSNSIGGRSQGKEEKTNNDARSSRLKVLKESQTLLQTSLRTYMRLGSIREQVLVSKSLVLCLWMMESIGWKTCDQSDLVSGGDLQDIEEVLSGVLALDREDGVGLKPRTVWLHWWVSAVAEMRHKSEKCVESLRSATDIAASICGDAHLRTASLRTQLGLALLKKVSPRNGTLLPRSGVDTNWSSIGSVAGGDVPVLDEIVECFASALSAKIGSTVDGISTAWSHYLLARALGAVERFHASAENMEHCIAVLSSHMGESSTHIYDMCTLSLASLYVMMGRVEEGVTVYERILALKEAAVNRKREKPHSQSMFVTLHNLAAMYQLERRFEKALEMYKRCLKHKKIVCGDRHAILDPTLRNIALIYQEINRPKDALRYQQERVGLDFRDATNNPDGEATAREAIMWEDVGVAHQLCGDWLAAKLNLSKSLELKERIFGDRAVPLISTLERLACVCEKLNEVETSLSWMQKALSLKELHSGEISLSVGQASSQLARMYKSAGKPDRAFEMLERSIQIRSFAIEELGDKHGLDAGGGGGIMASSSSVLSHDEEELLYRAEVDMSKDIKTMNSLGFDWKRRTLFHAPLADLMDLFPP